MSALKSCEHCGGTNIWRWIDDGEHIQCVTCGCGFHYSGSAADIEKAWNTRYDPNPLRVAEIQAHRAAGSAEHNPQEGRLHGYCIVCQVPFPCEYVGKPSKCENPWRYPSRGELPEADGWYVVTFTSGAVEIMYWNGMMECRAFWNGVRAWRELEPAPELEGGEKNNG